LVEKTPGTLLEFENKYIAAGELAEGDGVGDEGGEGAEVNEELADFIEEEHLLA
jgi:hypothetical protein